MIAGRPDIERALRSRRFIVFLAGEALLIAAFVALVRTPDHSFAYYAKLIVVEIAAVALALATEHRGSRHASDVPGAAANASAKTR
jgi:hypothetical protein